MSPARRPLVSCITGTIPSRFRLLAAAMANIRRQTYPNVEHCIAIEGEPSAVDATIACARVAARDLRCLESTRIVGLGRWWSKYLAASLSTVPFMTAQWMARGEYLMWWSDDERALLPDHIEALVDLLEATDSDFVYPRVQIVAGPGVPLPSFVIGTDPPTRRQITHCLFRAELLDYRGFTMHVGSGTDWDQISAWMAAGARWAMLPRVTYQHRIDKIGEGADFRTERQPLRGHRRTVTMNHKADS